MENVTMSYGHSGDLGSAVHNGHKCGSCSTLRTSMPCNEFAEYYEAKDKNVD